MKRYKFAVLFALLLFLPPFYLSVNNSVRFLRNDTRLDLKKFLEKEGFKEIKAKKSVKWYKKASEQTDCAKNRNKKHMGTRKRKVTADTQRI